MNRPFRRRRTALFAGTVLLTATLAAPNGLAVTAAPDRSTAPAASADGTDLPKAVPGQYIVTLADKPLTTYQGGVAGLKATKPAKNRKVDTRGTDGRRYSSYLTNRQQQVAGQVGTQVRRHYTTTLNGFVAELTARQAAELKKTPGVVSVVPNGLRKAQDDRKSTDFLKLSGTDGVWNRLGGQAEAGQGVVVGVVDTGIWPESVSLAGPKLGTQPPAATDPYRPYRAGSAVVMPKADGNTFTGECVAGEEFTADLCTTKLVSARYFGDAWLAQVPPEARADWASPRDGAGHGTHTATTAAGRNNVDASTGGINFGKISGVAPAAKVAVYKALWEGKDAGDSGGYTSDILAAIDQAVIDGVDVINYSVGSLFESDYTDPVQLAFLSAASAGIFVSASGGNAGPDAASLDNTSPWVTTVGASTVAPYAGTVVLGNGQKYAGISTTLARQTGQVAFVNGQQVKLAAASDADALGCLPNTLDPAKVAGKLVACDRVVGARVDKSAEVKRAGGIGMVLLNQFRQDALGDSHTVPSVHLDVPGSLAVKAYAATAGATAQLVPGNTTSTKIPYPQIAQFSSRGPSGVSKGDLLKPDLAAPGVNTLAAVAPPSNAGQNFAFYSGTSMAAPHVAGLAALYLAKHPDWSPMAVKSALVTTAGDLQTADGAVDKDQYASGAGQVQPDRMLTPGLIYDSGDADWLGYLEGQGIATGTGVPAIDPSNYNTPSIAVGQLLGTQTITRRVTAVTPGLYRATVSVPGMKAVVTPSILNFDTAGQTKTFTVKLTQDTAASNQPTSGWLTWRGGNTSVRSPITVVPTSSLAPAEVSGTGASGQLTYQATAGRVGSFALGWGLVSADPVAGSVIQNPTDEQLPRYEVTVTDKVKAIQWNVRAAHPDASVDLVLYRLIDGKLVFQDATGGDDNQASISVRSPAPGVWGVGVVSLTPPPGATTTEFTAQTNVVDWFYQPGLTVTPEEAPVAFRPYPITASWSGVRTDRRSTGYIEYPNGTGTLVSLN